MAGHGNPNWTKGISGNPGGKPKDTLGAFLREKKNLPEEIYNAVYPLLKSKSEKVRIQACEFLRDTRDGKPPQSVELAGADGSSLVVEVVNYSNLGKPTNEN